MSLCLGYWFNIFVILRADSAEIISDILAQTFVVSGTSGRLILIVKEVNRLQCWGKIPHEQKYPCLLHEHTAFLHALEDLTSELFDKPPT